jgi:hypothetical protein
LIYSAPELILLKWLEIIKNFNTGHDERFKDFAEDLKDGVAIASALENYILLNLKIVN